MTVELVEALKQKPSDSQVCISVKGNTYVAGGVVTMLGGVVTMLGGVATMLGGVVTIQGCNWVIVSNDVCRCWQIIKPMGAAAGLPNGSRLRESPRRRLFINFL